MTDKIIKPGSPINTKYNISTEDIKGMMSSGLPDEVITVKFVPTAVECQLRFKAPMAKQGWWIRVERKLYGEWYIVDTFVDHELVQYGPEWVEHHHQIIDSAFEAARVEMKKATH